MNVENYVPKDSYYNIVRKTCFISNLIYLLTHVLYLVFFLISGTYAMCYINIGSVLIYSSMFFFIKKKMYNVYVISCAFEIISYMSLATVLCGFAPGFHICLIGFCILGYFTAYFSANGKNIIKPIPLTIFVAVDYIFLYFWCHYNDAVFQLSEINNSILFVAHIIVVFSFILGFLTIFMRYVLRLEKRIIKESRIDNLTQVPNRNGLYDYINSIEDKKNCVLAIFDIDDFKVINDEYGHICGDYILKELARIVSEEMKDGFVSRFGGEEFIILVNNKLGYYDTIKELDDVRLMVSEYVFKYKDNELHTTITTGVAKYEAGISIDDWITLADKKLYVGKNSGKNKIVI